MRRQGAEKTVRFDMVVGTDDERPETLPLLFDPKSPEGAHAGDLPNLVVGPDGAGKLSATLAGATLERGNPASLLNPNGTSIVIHAKADDEVTDPSGNSGDRIACGIITGK